VYNPDRGDKKGKVPKGTLFEDLPDDWKCPICGAGKKMFRPVLLKRRSDQEAGSH
jgi:rubredoxin